MISVFIYTGLLCSVFYFILSKKLRNTDVSYSVIQIAAFFIFARIFPLLMLENHTTGNFIGFAADIVMIISLFIFVHKFWKNYSANVALVIYLFNPLSVMSILSGDVLSIIVNILLTVIITGIMNFSRNICSLRMFSFEYVIFCIGIYSVTFGIQCNGDKFSDLISKEAFPTMLVIGSAILVVFAVLFIRKLYKAKHTTLCITKTQISHEIPVVNKEHWGKINVAH